MATHAMRRNCLLDAAFRGKILTDELTSKQSHMLNQKAPLAGRAFWDGEKSLLRRRLS